MRGIRFLHSQRAGSVMPLVMLSIVISLATGAGLLTLGRMVRVRAVRTATEGSARCAADAGLAKAMYEMNQKLMSGWSAYNLPREYRQALPQCDATYSFVVYKVGILLKSILDHSDLATTLNLPGLSGGDYIVRSIGRCGQSQKIVSGVLRLQGRGEYGVLVQDLMSLKPGTLVDGMDSSDPTRADVPLEIGTTSTKRDKVVLNKGVVVDGDVLVGPGGDPDVVIKDTGATTGERYPMIEDPEFLTIPPPPTLIDRGKINVHGKTIKIDPKDSGTYDSINLKNGKKPAILEITKGEVVLYVTGDINLGQSCEIKVAKGASLSLYLDGNMKAGADSGFNNENTPPNLKIWGKTEGSQKIELNAKSEYFGQLYAPVAEVVARAKSDLYGAFTAKKFEMKAGGNLFYDGALRKVDENDQGVRFVLKRWREL